MRISYINAFRWLPTAAVVALLTTPLQNILVSSCALAVTEDETAKPTSREVGKQDGKRQSSGPSHLGPECSAVDRFFADELWAKVGERTCLKCHRADGDASDTNFVLQDTTRNRGSAQKNYAAFARFASDREGQTSPLLVKVIGGLDHGGGEVLKSDSSGYRILERFVRRQNRPDTEGTRFSDDELPPFFSEVQMMTPERLLRRVTLSLGSRLPSDAEKAAVGMRGLDAMDAILDNLMMEDAFYDRLKEGFNDIFLTMGYDGNGEEILSYDHFQKTRHWYQRHNLNKFPEKDRQRARWDLARVYRKAIRREPLELIEHVVRNDRPITELVTADYIMVSPYSARGYGLYETLHDQFDNPDDPFEYLPAKLPALTDRSGKVQKSATGQYPHAGLLSMFHYLRRYPTTETNRNRLRARMYYQHFLGVDIMQLAPRVTDAAAVDARYEIPTMQAADCVVCHKTIDPVAGLFQDFNKDGHLGPRRDGWYQDMFGPGLEGEDLPESDHWRALQWLGQRTAQDPRFVVAMAEHVYYIMMGRKVLMPPENIDDPFFSPKRRAYKKQRQLIEEASQRCRQGNLNLKVLIKSLIASDFYRADGLATVAKQPNRQAELDDVGLVRLLTPEQLERKLKAVFGKKWGRLDNRESQFQILYGGIDSKSVTERMTDPSGAMGAIQRIMANDVACKNVALDFTRDPAERLLFPNIELDVMPNHDAASDEKIRYAIVHLHAHLLGQTHVVDHPEVVRTHQLFAGIISDAQATEGLEKRGSYFCERIDNQRLDDTRYTLRAWRGVVTYLLRQHDFLYE